MTRDARFWRNVTIIAISHVAVLIALIHWSRQTASANLPSIVWMSGGLADGGPESSVKSAPSHEEMETAATASPTPEEEDQAPVLAPVKSDIQLPTPTPSLTPVVTPSARPPTPATKASPKPTPRSAPKTTPKKSIVAKVTPKPTPKKQIIIAAKKNENQTEDEKAGSEHGSGELSSSTGLGASHRSSEFSWYGRMLHDRFHKEWAQPTTVVATGTKMSAVVKIRIEKDGRVSNFTIVKPSGNVVVDESVAAVAQKVTRVDPLPRGLTSGAYYEVKINFELNPEQ